MQEFDQVITKAVPVKNKPKDTYRVAVKFMHGDADGYTTKTQDFPVGTDYTRESYEPSINEVLLYLKTFFDLEWNAGCEFCMGSKFRKQVLAKAGFDDETIARCEEDFLWESDMTTDHQYRARPESVNITYFDQNGVEFVVEAFVKGTSDKLSFTRKF
jgi:hypothetical protein